MQKTWYKCLPFVSVICGVVMIVIAILLGNVEQTTNLDFLQKKTSAIRFMPILPTKYTVEIYWTEYTLPLEPGDKGRRSLRR
jgi:hypothetical protein